MINSEFVSAVLFQVLLFFIFISIFFFTYSAFTEKNTVINQINFLVDETIAPILKVNSISQCKKYHNYQFEVPKIMLLILSR